MTRCAAVIHNSPIDVEDVFSHYDIRKLIAKMLTSEKVENPRMLTVPGRQILHYLGWIEHPSKIGFFSPEKGRLWYDFKQNVAYEEKRNLKQSLTSKTVDLQLLNQARSLIHMWEYLQYRQSISTPIKN